MADRNYFPPEFVPGKFHVICGRGKKSYGHVGNQWFLTVVSGRINDYARADTKQEKSQIVQKLVGEIRDAGGFIRQEEQTGRYYRVAEGEGRDKVSQALRDALKHKYKSSKDVKRTNRKAKRMSAQHGSTTSSNRRRESMGSHSERSINSEGPVDPAGSTTQQSPLQKPQQASAPSSVPALNNTSQVAVQQPLQQQPVPMQEQPTLAAQQQQQQQPTVAVQQHTGPLQQQSPGAVQQPGSQSICGGSVPPKSTWNPNLYVIPNPAPVAPAQPPPAVAGMQPPPPVVQGGPVEAFPVQAFPDDADASLGYNNEAKQQCFQGNDFQQHRRLSGSSHATGASTHSGYHSSGAGTAREYWSQGEASGDWDNDAGGTEVDLDFCLDLDDMEQQAAAMGVDFTDMVYASPPRPNTNTPNPGHPQQPPTNNLLVDPKQPEPQQQQPRRLSGPQASNVNIVDSSQAMRLQIQQMLARTQSQQQQKQQALLSPQNQQQIKGASVGGPLAAVTAANYNYPTSNGTTLQATTVAPPAPVQQPLSAPPPLQGATSAPPQRDNQGRIFYDV